MHYNDCHRFVLKLRQHAAEYDLVNTQLSKQTLMKILKIAKCKELVLIL